MSKTSVFLKKVLKTVTGTRATPTKDAAGTHAVYAPVQDDKADPGEVVWTWIPYEDGPDSTGETGKDRPVLVVGRHGKMLHAFALTTKEHPERNDYFPLGTGSWDPQQRPSWVKLEDLLLIDPTKVRRIGAIIDQARFKKVVGAARQWHPEL